MAHILAAHHSAFDVLPAEYLNKAATGVFIPMTFVQAKSLLHSRNLWLGPRALLEADESFRQLITYAVVRRGARYASYSRSKKGNESRLHSNISIGIGGHIDAADCRFEKSTGEVLLTDTVIRAMARELSEETTWTADDPDSSVKFLGLILDNSNAVGRVHVGLAIEIVMNPASQAISAAEDHLEDFQFATLSDLLRDDTCARLETWSKVFVDYLKDR